MKGCKNTRFLYSEFTGGVVDDYAFSCIYGHFRDRQGQYRWNLNRSDAVIVDAKPLLPNAVDLLSIEHFDLLNQFVQHPGRQFSRPEVMALNSSIKVAMPEHGAVKRRMGDKVYVYYATAVYRNEKGQLTGDRVSIGRYDEESGMLIPNRNYYEVYLKADQPITKVIFDYGVYYAFAGIVKGLGIEKELKRFFPENWKELLTISQYMLSEGNVMAYIEDYCETLRTYKDISKKNGCHGSRP